MACNVRGELPFLLFASKLRLQLNKECLKSVTGGSRCKSDAVPQPWERFFQVGLPITF